MSGDLSLTSVFSFHNLAYGNCNYIFIYKVALTRRQVGTFRSPSQVDICPLVYHILWKLHSFSFYCWSSSRKAVNTNFYSFWCDPTGNRTRLYSFNSWVADALSTQPLIWWTGGQPISDEKNFKFWFDFQTGKYVVEWSLYWNYDTFIVTFFIAGLWRPRLTKVTKCVKIALNRCFLP